MTDRRERTIYGLYDTEHPGTLRYVGQTVALSSRLWAHRHPERTPNARGPVVAWLRDIGPLRTGHEVLEYADGSEAADEAERRVIAELHAYGHDLLNVQEGGRHGGRSEANRAALRAAARPNKVVGSAHHDARLDEEQAAEIKTAIIDGLTDMQISTLFPVARQTVHAIRVGRTWRHVTAKK